MLVIFDCDGVLVDSEPIANAALSEALAALGLRMTVEETMTEFMGRDRRHLRSRAAELLGRPLPHAFEADFDARLHAALGRDLRPIPGIEAALDGIGHPTCVASSSRPAGLRFTLGMTGLLERFEGRIFSATEVERGKPAPDLFLHAAARMGHSPDDCVVVEDSPAGVEAAGRAGMRCLHYGSDFTDMRDLPTLL